MTVPQGSLSQFALLDCQLVLGSCIPFLATCKLCLDLAHVLVSGIHNSPRSSLSYFAI